MDLKYPINVLESLEKLSDTLASVSKDGTLPRLLPSMWCSDSAASNLSQPNSALGIVAEYRLYGSCAANVAELLAIVGRSHVPLLDTEPATGGIVALGARDSKIFSQGADLPQLTITNDTGRGRLSVSPFFLPCTRLLFLGSESDAVVLAECNSEGTSVEPVGDSFEIVLEDAPVNILAEGNEAIERWASAEKWEALALVGLTAGVVDRSYQIALDALWKGQQEDKELAREQVAQFQLADNFIDRQAVEHLVYDTAIDAQNGRLSAEKMAMVRYATAEMAQKCAGRAMHLAAIFDDSSLEIAKWLFHQAHNLCVYGMTREQGAQMAAAGLARGMSVE